MADELILSDGSMLPIRDRRAGSAVRDPRGATQVLGYTGMAGLPQIDDWNAEQAFRFGYAMNVVAYRCVQLRAMASASVPFVAGRKFGDAKTIRESSPLQTLLGPPPGGPAPKMSARKLFRWTFAQKIVTGRRAWEIERDPRTGRPVAFWPLSAARLQAVPAQSGTEWFSGFKFGNWSDPVKFKSSDVFYGWDPAGHDFRQAESAFQVARYDLSLVSLCDRYSLGFLTNNAVPAAIITTTRFPNENARRKFLQNWSADFSGVDNAGRVALNEVSDDGDGPVGDSIDVKVLGLSAKDARLVEMRKDIALEIAIALGTPWSKLDASGRTFANAGQEDTDWWENTILPELLDLQDDINMHLAPELGDEVGWFDLRGVRALRRPLFPVADRNMVGELLDRQVITRNEVRVDLGLESMVGLDTFVEPAAVPAAPGAFGAPAGPADAPVSAPAPTATPEPALTSGRGRRDAPPVGSGAGSEARFCDCEQPSPDGNGGCTTCGQAIDPADCCQCDQPQPGEDGCCSACGAPMRMRAATTERRVADPAAIEARRARTWHAADAVVTNLEQRWTRSWTRMFHRQQAATLDRLTGKRGRQQLERRDGEPIDVESIFSRSHWTAEADQLASDLYEETTVAGLSRLSTAFGVSFDVSSRWVQDFIAARSNQLAGQVTSTTYEQIQQALNDGVAAGESIDDIATRVRAVFTAATNQRATTIARTEAISAYNGSATLGAAQLPADVVAAQEWIATHDSRTRDAHDAADGQQVDIGMAFTVDGEQLAYPGDPAGDPANVINCRCTVGFLTPDEVAAERTAMRIDTRTAVAAVNLITPGDFDARRFRRALQESAA